LLTFLFATITAWFVQVGELNTVHHLWQFADLEERRSQREQSWGVSGWADTVCLKIHIFGEEQEELIMIISNTGPQNRPSHSEHEESHHGSHALEPGQLNAITRP
jgi:hypothetical protein